MTGPIEQSSPKVKLFGTRNSAPAYSIRDFLQRCVVAFEWIELQNDEGGESLQTSKRTSYRAFGFYPKGSVSGLPVNPSRVDAKLGDHFLQAITNPDKPARITSGLPTTRPEPHLYA